MEINAQDVPENIIFNFKDNKVKSITGFAVKIVDNTKLPQSKYKFSYNEFNEKGILIKSLVFEPLGNVIKEKKIDSSGKVIKELFFKNNGEIDYEFIYDYDVNNNRTIKEMYIGKELWYKCIAKRDTSNCLIEDVCYKPTGEIIRIDKFEYDSLHNLIKIEMGNMGEWQLKYDNKKLISLFGSFVSGSAVGETYEYYYDQKDLLIERIHKHYETVHYEYSFY